MYKVLAIILLSSLSLNSNAQLFSGKSGEASFFSSSPLEDISAVTTKVNSLLNTSNGNIAVLIPVTSFKFENSLMEEHFNEKYLESDKYPKSSFKGKIIEKLDYAADGEYKVTTTGTLKIHGIEKEYTVPGMVTVEENKITYFAKFNVTLKDHKIKIPKVVFQNIAEVVEVSIKSDLSKYVSGKKESTK